VKLEGAAAPPPKDRTAPLKLDGAAASLPKDRTAPLKLEAPVSPALRERTAPIRTEPVTPPPKEKTSPVRLEPDAPAAAAPEPLEGVLRREISRKWAWTVVSLVLAPALFVVLFLFSRSRQIVPGSEHEGAAVEAAVAEKRHLLDDGNRLLADGKIEEARQRFLELARVAPESAAARDALRRSERLLAKKAEQERRNAEVSRQVAAAEAARVGGDPAGAAAAAEAALALEPDHAEAVSLRRAALDEIRRLPKADQRKAEARLKSLRAAAPPVPTPAPASAAVRGAAAGPARQLAFRSPFSAGTVFVRMNGTEVLRRSFDFGGRAGGLLEAGIDLPARTGELRAWVFSADGVVRAYAATRLDLAEGDARPVVLGLDRAQKLSVGLE